MMGTGPFVPQPAETPEYRRGYLCGLIRGDGHLGSYRYTRPGRAIDEVHRFRLALTDAEALRRAAITSPDSMFRQPSSRFPRRLTTTEHDRDSNSDPAKRRANRRADQLADAGQCLLAEGVPGRHLRRRGMVAMPLRLRISNCDEQISRGRQTL